jgi:hypothetical protein
MLENVRQTGYIGPVFPDDSRKELSTVLSYLTGRSLSKEEIWTAMELPRSTYYDQLEKGTLLNADNLRTAAKNLGINRAELLTRYRLIDPIEILSLAEAINGPDSLPPQSITKTRKKLRKKSTLAGASVTELPQREGLPPL